MSDPTPTKRKYEVQVNGTAQVFAFITVEAESPAQAESLAVQQASQGHPDWALRYPAVSCYADDSYLYDPGDLA